MRWRKDYWDHIQGCDICKHYVAICMVSPIRGFPTKEDYRKRDEKQKADIDAFEVENKDILIEHGMMEE